MHTEFWFEGLKGRYNWEHLSINGKILKCILGKQGECMDWIHLAAYEDQWQDLETQ
jgi:hypothetical protein